jgi:Flp pilus assembly protein TadD
MSWWGRLLGGKSKNDVAPRRVDYLSEAMALERQGDFEAALTSYRLALRDQPHDTKILLNIAIAYSKTGRLEDAIRSYRRALELAPEQTGANYGLAFLLLKRGDRIAAERHLEAFLGSSPAASGMEQWVDHARQTLGKLRGEEPQPAAETEKENESGEPS